MKFYRNKETGELITVMDSEQIDLTGLEEIIPNTVDAAKEKHVPVISREGQTVTVSVGSVEHPMLENHFIEWIILETNQGFQKKDLKPGDAPTATFALAEGEEAVAAYESCNLHGIWKAEA